MSPLPTHTRHQRPFFSSSSPQRSTIKQTRQQLKENNRAVEGAVPTPVRQVSQPPLLISINPRRWELMGGGDGAVTRLACSVR